MTDLSNDVGELTGLRAKPGHVLALSLSVDDPGLALHGEVLDLALGSDWD